MPSSQFLWELVKNNNAFLRKNLNGAIFSAERGNLYAKNSYKFSGLANSSIVDISADGEQVSVAVSAPKKANKPSSFLKAQKSKQNARKVNKSVANQVAAVRPDLKKAAIRRASAVTRSIRAVKASKKN
uniref:Ribosomal eL28/Mak16 domain-containing protein n=1 Tax=Polytomella parva TaxID=51329 RepID=A0A7S0UR37_9CHLO|mmetsp:Transcript_11732/g.21081  ORF Transcript_11732/g.21081 Transcript_11732/m.21081 type:complete len:129 (+) Transcript_11732:81-467(+)|eukprot:CAMPEP_0175050108 /NCGR_PEP_ID=MMETSP0052_2-20121109/7087_1 /TAXON_ID=51329 ORGANISM="Polytomella parva, Strain SAG 63-3" /NCGR_SAMPLE_ID=MMETSP0052_2 /ASSEMBLY_ACC=CAM_ASM_000194 /LENGTH=128 /DNA_ID=CAMNT_0016314297 /DNA_START=76 /DNA_END=462 /DNA_ORIENTATION=-